MHGAMTEARAGRVTVAVEWLEALVDTCPGDAG